MFHCWPRAWKSFSRQPAGFSRTLFRRFLPQICTNYPAQFLHDLNEWVYAKQNQNPVEGFSPAQDDKSIDSCRGKAGRDLLQQRRGLRFCHDLRNRWRG